MKTILVTGSNGLLGQKITAAQPDYPDIRLVATSKGTDRFEGTATYIYATLDLLDTEQMQAVLYQYRPDVLIHTAAMTNADTCAADPEGCTQLNVDVVGELIRLCERLGTHLIYLSTDFVFDGAAGPYRETDEPNPLSHYGASKLMAEHLVKAMKGNWTIVRTVLVYGVLADMSRSNIVLWAKNALQKQEPIRVVNDQWRTPTLAEDLATACLDIALKGATGIYHISGPELMNVAGLVRAVAQFWGLDERLITEVPSATFVQPATRPARTGFILDKAMRDINFRPRGLREGLALVASQLEN